MIRAIFSIVATAIMMAVPFLVNARAAETPNFNQRSHKGGLKTDFSRIIEMLKNTGETDRMKPGLAELIGLTGEPPVKGRDNDTGREYRECSMVYPDDSDGATPAEAKTPVCVYFNRRIDSGHDGESHWYRVSMSGKLEKAVIHYNKTDEDDKSVPGSDVIVPEDINSPKVQKAFRTEMDFWLKNSQKEKPGAKSDAAGNIPTPAAAAP